MPTPIPDLFLWSHPVSPYACKIRLALREKSIPFRFETPRGGGSGIPENMDPSFITNNKRLEFPTLIVDGGELVIFDSTIILEFIEDMFPDTMPLRPRDPRERARARMIEDVCDSQYEAVNWGMGEIRTFKRAEGELATQMMEKAKRQIKEIQEWLTSQLGGAEWFNGEKFGYADVCVWPFVNRSATYGLEPEPGTPLRNWFERAKERPSVRSVAEEVQEGLKGLGGASEALKKGWMKREYRDHRLEWMVKSGGLEIVRQGMEKGDVRFLWPLGEE